MVRSMARLVKSVAVLSGAALALSFTGPLLPLGDSLAVIRMPLGVLFGLAMIRSDWPAALRWPLACVPILLLGQVVVMKTAHPPPGTFTVYQKNLLYSNLNDPRLVADILTLKPDVVTVQELTLQNQGILDAISEAYPDWVTCQFSSFSWVAVVSPAPPIDSVCIQWKGLAGAKVISPEGPVWVFSLHSSWPWPYPQTDRVPDQTQALQAADAPVVLAGDFNMVPWGGAVRRLGRATGGRRAGPLRPSFWLQTPRLPLPIDHVFAPGGGEITVQPRFGSDHHGILARVYLNAD